MTAKKRKAPASKGVRKIRFPLSLDGMRGGASRKVETAREGGRHGRA
jgi:hypothetical protein